MCSKSDLAIEIFELLGFLNFYSHVFLQVPFIANIECFSPLSAAA